MSSTRRLKKNAAPPPSSDDDSSVDSKGNLKGFIVYSDDENDKKKGKTKTSRYNTRSKKETGKIEKRMTKMEIDDERPSRKSTIDETYRSPRLGSVAVPAQVQAQQQKKKKRRADTSSSSSSSSTTSYSADSDEEEEFYGEGGEEDDDEESYDSAEDSDYDDEEDERMPSIMIIGGGQEDDDRMVPKRHNMKKEAEIVRKFVDLVTVPPDENTIDNQIDMFKGLTGEEQRKVIDVLENRASNPHILNPQESLMFKIMTMKLPAEIQGMVLNKYQSLQMLDPGSSEYFKNRAWLDKLTSLPLGYYKNLPVRIGDGSEACTAFMERAKRCLNDAIYGQEEAKLQILQYIAAKIANPEKKGTSLILAGPPGIGKTQLIKSGIAKAFDWPFQFISLGGDSDASTYTGHQLVYESSHCGKIVNSLISAKSMSMILMFDEVDKISATPKGEEVQHLLIHLTDPVQNELFEDKYLAGIPLDLGSVLYVFSANDIGRLDRILLDRMTVIQLAGYNAKEKLTIAEQFLLPNALDEVGLKDKVGISKEILQYIIEHYAGDEPGVRELKRCMEQLAQKINMLRMFNSADLPFHVKDFKLPFIMKKEHVELFLKRRENRDKPPMGMYL